MRARLVCWGCLVGGNESLQGYVIFENLRFIHGYDSTQPAHRNNEETPLRIVSNINNKSHPERMQQVSKHHRQNDNN